MLSDADQSQVLRRVIGTLNYTAHNAHKHTSVHVGDRIHKDYPQRSWILVITYVVQRLCWLFECLVSKRETTKSEIALPLRTPKDFLVLTRTGLSSSPRSQDLHQAFTIRSEKLHCLRPWVELQTSGSPSQIIQSCVNSQNSISAPAQVQLAKFLPPWFPFHSSVEPIHIASFGLPARLLLHHPDYFVSNGEQWHTLTAIIKLPWPLDALLPPSIQWSTPSCSVSSLLRLSFLFYLSFPSYLQKLVS